ncbi:cytochrome P450 [Rhexocercosporidium sp. MPI-PUGE-AT-0058]|nr:cytochrome P450 [Rhexocercosporidium sp. MPI-PUGE-AT-0058]
MDYKLPLGINAGTVFVSSIIAFVYIIFRTLQTSKSKLSSLPTIGTTSQPHLQIDLIDGTRRYPDTPYLIPDIPNGPKTLILPVRYLDEIKSLPESKLSFAESLYHRFSGKYSTIGILNKSMITSIKVDLTHNIARNFEALQLEADLAIPDCIGECQDWTPIQIYPKILRIVALLSGRIFVGLPLSRDEEWIETTISYTEAAFACYVPVKNLFPLTRDVFAPFLPEVQRIKQYRARGAQLLAPVLEERRESMKDPNFEPPADMIQFMIQNAGDSAHDALFQSYMQMVISLVAIHSTAMNITHAIYDLANHPESIAPLREELEAVLSAENGILNQTSMTKLQKMDSFIKESQRLNPPNALSINRIATSNLTLSDGLYIPKGTCIAISSIGIYHDPSIYPSPDTFLPFRFSDLRSLPENANKYQLVTTSKESLAFGHGTHACPGRFFASNEIKVILAGLLSRYDVKFQEGQGRPENMNGKTLMVPNQKAEVLFRKRGVS